MSPRITGTHVYTYPKCARAAALELHLSRDERRPLRAEEEFARARGRDFEAELVAELDVVEPEFPRGDFAAGAEATMTLLRAGHPLVFQAVLRAPQTATTVERLGLPDLMRRVEGESELGEHHFEVVDIKSSGRPRGDQILQVVFYSRLLAGLQGRMPDAGGIVLKTGEEWRFKIADYLPALEQVDAALEELAGAPVDEIPRAAYCPTCTTCHWSAHCLPGMVEADDLSLVQGMTSSLRAQFEAANIATAANLANATDGTRLLRLPNIERSVFERLVFAAQSRVARRPLRESVRGRLRLPRGTPVLVHLLTDAFADRVLWFGAMQLTTAQADGTLDSSDAVIEQAMPTSRAEEWSCFQSVLAAASGARKKACLLHYGRKLPSWIDEQSLDDAEAFSMRHPFVDAAIILRGAGVYPAPVFGMEDHLRHGLGVDPWTVGPASAAALWAQTQQKDSGDQTTDDVDLIAAKGAADLRHLAAMLRDRLTPTHAGDAPAEGSGGCAGDVLMVCGDLAMEQKG